jgi:hypothetical protein
MRVREYVSVWVKEFDKVAGVDLVFSQLTYSHTHMPTYKLMG